MNMKFDVSTAKFEDPATQAMWEGIRDSHQRGPTGKPLVVFGDGPPRADWPSNAADAFDKVVSAGRRVKDIIEGDPEVSAEN